MTRCLLLFFCLPLCLQAQYGLLDSILIPRNPDWFRVACSAEGDFYYSSSLSPGLMRLRDGNTDTLHPLARNLVLHCGGKEYCTLNPRPNAPRWKERKFITLVQKDSAWMGINTQLSDYALYDSDMHLLSSHAFEIPFFAGGAVLYHNYFSEKPAAFLGDTLAMVLTPTEALGDSTGKLKGEIPMVAFFDVKDIPTTEPDTFGEALVRPFAFAGALPKRIQWHHDAYRYALYAGIVRHPQRREFLVWHPADHRIFTYSPAGHLLEVAGRKFPSPFSFKKIKAPKGENYRHDHSWAQYLSHPVYGDVILDQQTESFYRLVLSALPPKKLPASFFQPNYNKSKADRLRQVYLEVYQANGKRLKKIRLDISEPHLLAARKGELWISGFREGRAGLFKIRVREENETR